MTLEPTFYDNTPFNYGYSSKEDILENMNHNLKEIIIQNKDKVICDIGCGDWEFSKHINYDKMNIEYTGIDCVEHIIK